MAISNLLSTIQTAITQSKTLAFTGQLVASSNIGTLLGNLFYYSPGTVNLTNANAALNGTGDAVLITGNTQYLFVQGASPDNSYACTVNITLTIDTSSNVQMVLILSIPDGKTFPQLLQGLTDPPFQNITFTKTSFIVNSIPYTDSVYNQSFQPGTNFTGTPDLSGVYGVIESVLTGTSDLFLSGTISNAELRLLNLSTSAYNGKLGNTAINNVTLSFVISQLGTQGDLTPSLAQAYLSGTFVLDVTSNKTGNFNIELVPNSTQIEIIVDFTNISLTDFTLFIPFTSSSIGNPFSLLPVPVTSALQAIGNAFLLKELSLTFDYSSITFISAGIAISTNTPNGIIPFSAIPQIKITELDFDWTFDSAGDVTFLAQTTISISNYKVDVGFQTQTEGNYTIFVKQDPTTPLQVSDLISSLIPGLTGVPTDLAIEEFSLAIIPDSNQYFLDIDIQADWPLPGIPNLSLTDVSFNGAYFGDLTPSLNMAFNGAFVLVIDPSDPTLNVNINLSAQTNNGGSGWIFNGNTGPNQVIPMGSFIQALVSQFSTTAKVPDCIASLTIDNIYLSYETDSKEFTFGAEVDFTIYDEPVKLLVNIDFTPGGDKKFSGVLYADPFQFGVTFDSTSGSQAFVASCSPLKGGNTSFSIQSLVSSISKSLAADIPDIQIQLEDLKFAYLNQGGTKQFAVGLDLAMNVSLSEIPIIGNKLPANANIAVNDLSILYCSAAFTQAQIGLLNGLLPQGVSPFVNADIPQGVQASGNLSIMGINQTLSVGSTNNTGGTSSSVSSPPQLSNSSTTFVAAASDNNPAPGIKWINIQKTFGPVQIQSLGVSFQDGYLAFSINGSVTLGPITMSLMGLTLGSKLDSFSPMFDLSGMGVGYSAPPLTIEGAILKVTPGQADVKLQFDGDLVIQAAEWGLSGIASFALMQDNTPSFFIFVDINAILGGPPYFIVQGLMGGFGFNRSLTIPSFDQVSSFPLLAISSPQPNTSASQQAAATLSTLESGNWITPNVGGYWLAAGIKFSSFEIVNGELLLIATFGNELQFALLGLAWLSLPQGVSMGDAFVFVELQLEAVIKPTEGYFSVAGSLTSSSFVLTQSCHLTGGFAFDLWFGNNPYAGQFVMTVGGYHPAFQAPLYYPKVARLGFNWQVSSDISIKGGSYFAITPSCGMAGGSLEALYQSGPIKAWFTAQADMLVTWNPFSFTADISIDLGASVRLNLLVCHKTVSVSIGASLNLWGPPLGGVVRVHIVIVTVSIHFGSDDAADKNKLPLQWDASQSGSIQLDGFTSLLPKSTTDNTQLDVCKATANTGLYKTLNIGTDGTIINNNQAIPPGAQQLWVVRQGKFSFTTQSAIPSTTLTHGTSSTRVMELEDSPQLSIRPMGLNANVTSTHNIQISKNGSGVIDTSSWQVSPVTGSLAAAMWGTPLTDSNGNFVQAPATPSNDVVSGLITGYNVIAPQAQLGYTFGAVSINQLEEDTMAAGTSPISTAVAGTTTYAGSPDSTSIGDIANINTTSVSTNRTNIYTMLQNNGLATNMSNDNMTGLHEYANDLYSNNPMEVNS